MLCSEPLDSRYVPSEIFSGGLSNISINATWKILWVCLFCLINCFCLLLYLIPVFKDSIPYQILFKNRINPACLLVFVPQGSRFVSKIGCTKSPGNPLASTESQIFGSSSANTSDSTPTETYCLTLSGLLSKWSQ